jgi:phytoene/squalene synthetase
VHTARSNPSMALALAVCCPPRGFLLASAVYAYFRWADDIVDAPGRDASAVRRFMGDQAAIIEGSADPRQPAERALRRALADRRLGPRLLPAVERMAQALAYDACRGQGPIPEAELQRQVERIGDAFVEAIWVCSGGRGRPSSPALLLARAATATHMLRDRIEDQSLGYCNLPREQFGATVPTPGPALEAWLAVRRAELEAWFAEGLAAVDSIPERRTRALVRLLGERYREVLEDLPLASRQSSSSMNSGPTIAPSAPPRTPCSE